MSPTNTTEPAPDPPQVAVAALRLAGISIQHALRAGATREQVADAVRQAIAAAHTLGPYAGPDCN